MILMHQIINEIIASTRNRIPLASNTITKRINSRDFKKSIKDKKQQGLIPVISEVKPSSPTRFIRNVTPHEAAGIARSDGICGCSSDICTYRAGFL